MKNTMAILTVAIMLALVLIVPIIPAVRYQPVEARSLNLPDPTSNTKSEEIKSDGLGDLINGGNAVDLSREAHSEEKPTSNRIGFESYGEDRFSLTYWFVAPRVEHAFSTDRSSQYFTVNVDDLPKLGEAGSPVLPFETARILIPNGKQIANFSIIGGKKDLLPGTYLIEFGQTPVRLDQADCVDPSQADSRNETIYSSLEPFPGTLYSGFSVQRKMGYDVLLMNIFPVEYIPKTGGLFYYENITVTVETISKTAADSVSRRYSPQVEAIGSFVDNSEVIQLNDSEILESTYQYVIITSEELANTPGSYNFQALRDDKISRGIPARIVTTEWIYANYNGIRPDGGQDDQTKIRNFIIDAYQNWGTMYVLLGGDGDGNGIKGDTRNCAIPHRGFCISPYDQEKDIPADLYYGCLDGTFDYNANGLYGEPNDGPGGGEVDLLAEVYVGRACVDSAAEVQNFVHKTLTYQNTPANENLRKAWMVGEWLGFGGVAEWGGNYKDEIKNGSDAHGYNTIGFLDSPYGEKFDLSTLYDRDYPGNNWQKNEIINVINSNVNLINHLGHADVGYVMKMSNPDVDSSLVNDQYFIGYSQGCYCGAFDNRTTTPDVYSTDDCISEHLTVGAHGAVAFIANSRYGYGAHASTDGYSQHFDRQFWDAVLGEDLLNVGIANQDSKEDNVGRIGNYYDRWCYYEINLFGDPELKIRLPPVPDHDLDVDLQVPIYSRLGDSLLLNATVRNRGLYDESQVKLSLIVDGFIVQNATINELVGGASVAIDCIWTPTTEAVYNVTAYVEPVPGENETANNAQSSSVLVHASSLLVVNDDDGSSFINGTSLAAFRSAILSTGHNCLVWNESSMGNPPLDVLTRFNPVIWTCGDHWNKAVDHIDSASLRSYLDQGGSLLLEGEDIGYDHQGDNFLVKVSHSIYRVDNANSPGLIVAAQNHPITQGLPANFIWASYPPYPDGVEAANLGIEILRYLGANWAAVTAFEGKSSKAVYYAFPLYCLGTIERETLVANSISWLLKSPRTYNWIDSRPISNSSENERRPAIATGSTGNLYAAYEHYNTASGFYDICVSQTTDQGNTWSILETVSDTHNLGYPSIAIDVGDSDNVYVALEREWTSTDHDIFVLRRVGGAWSVTSVANILGNDDRFPSITCEYQYGTADRQYISYEHVYSYDDRDVMFASSQNDGASWSLNKLHGGWPDSNVHCQTSIATTHGSDGSDIIYVAYKWGADYATAYDIVIDISKDRGSNWAQKWVCDESSRDKNWPSIAATHGGGTVVIAWHVYWDSTFLNDIQYAYSTDNGEYWSNSWLAMDSYVDEKTPAVVVDGQESTSSEMYGRIHIAYWRDTQISYWEAPFDAPWSWTPKERVSDPAAYASAVYTKPCITVCRSDDGSHLPVIAWTDYRGSSYDIYYSTKARAHVSIINSIDGTSYNNFTTAQKHVGDTFTVNVTITDGNITGWQTEIEWNYSQLQYVDSWVPSDNIFAGHGPIYSIDNSRVGSGILVIGAITNDSYVFVGSGTMYQLEFRIILPPTYEQPVTSNMTFADIGGSSGNTFLLYGLLDVEANYDWNNGSYKYVTVPSISIVNSIDGTSYNNFTTAQKHVGDTFTVNVTITNGNITGWQTEIVWNYSQLQYVGAWIPSDNIFWNKNGIHAMDTSSVSSGIILMGGNIGVGYSAFVGNGTMAQIEFKIKLAPSAGQTLTSSIVFADIGIGGYGESYLLYGILDVEANYEWNNGSYKYTSMPRDVAVTNVTSKTVVDQGYDFNITVGVADFGSYQETFNLTLYATIFIVQQNVTLQIASQNVTLESGNYANITFVVNTAGYPYGNYTISAYAEPVPDETDIVNNNCTYSVPVHIGVPGDVSGTTPGVYDGITNMKDIAYLVALFQTKPTKPNWNPNADVNSDGVVDMKDIATAVYYFNQHE